MIACTCARIHDGSPCLCACHLRYEGRDGAAIINSDETADLAIIGARRHTAAKLVSRAIEMGRSPGRLTVMYADDLYPMVYRGEDELGRTVEKVAPWHLAMEVD